VVGDLELQFYVGREGLVWLPIDPRAVRDVKAYLQGEYIKPIIMGADDQLQPLTHGFAQIGNPAYGVQGLGFSTGNYSFNRGVQRLSCTSLRVKSCESNMMGFKVRDSALSQIYNIFKEPCYIPAEYLEYNAFPTPPGASGLQSTTNTALNNVKDIYVMFPKHSNDYTVFENPCINQFALRVMGVQYPERVISTLGSRFYQMELTAADLDGPLRPTNEFVDSYTMKRNYDTGMPYTFTPRDGTSFALIIQCERNESGYVFDGINSGGQSTPIDIQFVPIYPGANDTYYNVDIGAVSTTGTSHPPAPQLWLCRDVYWSMDVENGLKFHKYGEPAGSQSA
jgi:hypothetical protein